MFFRWFLKSSHRVPTKSTSPREIHMAQQCEEPLLATVSDTFLAPSRPKILTGAKNHRWKVASDKFSAPSRSETETDVKKPLLEPVLGQIQAPSSLDGHHRCYIHVRKQRMHAQDCAAKFCCLASWKVLSALTSWSRLKLT